MEHIFWLNDNLVGGRPGPNLVPWNLRALRNSGVDAILSVNDGELVQQDELNSLGFKYLCTPLSENAPPRMGDLDTCSAALPKAYAFVSRNRSQGLKTLVHCRQGRDRTGLFLAYYLVKQNGVSPEEAVMTLRAVRGDALAAEGWDEFAIQVLQSC